MRRGAGAAARAESAAGQGDREQTELDATFEDFCQENFVLVERFVRSRCRDRGLAEDAVQEAFITARARWNEIRHFEKPLGWMYKTALNKLLVQQRRRRQEVAMNLDEIPAGRLVEPADSREAQELLRGWLQQLPPRQAEVFSMAHDGWSDLEIAQVLGIAYNTVRAYRQEARRRLKELAQQAGFETSAGRGRA